VIRGLYQNIFDNPILTRELRRRMRGKALIFSIIGYIIIMTVASVLILITSMNPLAINQSNPGEVLQSMANTGDLVFKALTVIQGLLVIIIAPTITAGMTTMEKERKTFDFLRVTTITPWMYITGCFLSTVFYVSLALICALPLISLSFLYGGVSMNNVVDALLTLLGISMILSALGLYVSSVRERTRTAQGIVVFIIFLLVFGGPFIFGFIQSQFGAAAGTLFSQRFTLPLGISVSGLVIVFLTNAFFAMVLLLMATRKLFDPYDSRAVSHWQFAIIFAMIMLTILIPLPNTNVSPVGALAFVTILSLFMATCALNFAVGRMEVGDEIWQMKRLFPILRPFDQTIPYLLLFGFLFYFCTTTFIDRLPPNHSILNLNALRLSCTVGLAGFIFFCFFARLATAISVGRKGAGRLTLMVMGAFWIVLPLICSIIIGIMKAKYSQTMMFDVFHQIGRLSPFFVVNDALDQTATGAKFYDPDILIALLTYGFFSLITLAIGEPKRFKRWRGYSWHYDMPSG